MKQLLDTLGIFTMGVLLGASIAGGVGFVVAAIIIWVIMYVAYA